MNIPKKLKSKVGLITTGLFVLQQVVALAAPMELTLKDGIDLALKNNPAIYMAIADREKSKWGIDEAKAGKMPTVSLGSSYNFSGRTDDGDFNNSIRMSLPIYSGGRIEGQIKQAELGLTTADLNVEKSKQQVKLDATNAYYTVLQTSKMVLIDQETVNNLKEHLRIAQAKYEAGVVAKSDILRSEVELANAEQNLTKTQNSYALAVTNLLNIMNLDARTEIMLRDELQQIPADKTLEECIAFAKTHRPEIAQAQTSISMAASNLKVSKDGKLPTVSLSASAGLNDNFLPNSDDWSIGASASWNLYDAGANKAKVKQSEAALDKAKLQAQQIGDNVEQEVRQSYLSMKEAEKRIDTTQVAIAKAAEDLYIAKEKYAAGVGTNLDAIDAQLTLAQAKTNHIQALYDYNINKAKLDKAIGLGNS